jgi:tetrahydromethanopterin S-methyltransferase subunit H
VATWKGLKKKLGGEAKDACVAAACASAVAIGGDFLLYGPAEDAKYIFPAVAMIDTGQSQVAIERGLKPYPNHPRYRVG